METSTPRKCGTNSLASGVDETFTVLCVDETFLQRRIFPTTGKDANQGNVFVCLFLSLFEFKFIDQLRNRKDPPYLYYYMKCSSLKIFLYKINFKVDSRIRHGTYFFQKYLDFHKNFLELLEVRYL